MSAKVLFWDIETAPILAYVWDTYDQTIGLNQIHTDWHVLAWAAKWKDSKEVMYMDQRNSKDITDDKKILEGLWKLLDEADVVVTQNGVKFDAKKVNARFIQHGMKPPSPYKHVDTLKLAKKQFGFTSNKLAYMTDKLCTKYKKLDHGKFPGFSLWQECLKGNKKAWKEMETYNKYDVLALEELYGKLAPWGAGFNHNLFLERPDFTCQCGSTDFINRGFYTTQTAKYRNYVCKVCGASHRGRVNLLSDEEKLALKEGPGGWKVGLDRTCCGDPKAMFVYDTRSNNYGRWRVLRCKHCNLTKDIGKPEVPKQRKLPKKTSVLKDCRCCRAARTMKEISREKNHFGYRRIYRCDRCAVVQKAAFHRDRRVKPSLKTVQIKNQNCPHCKSQNTLFVLGRRFTRKEFFNVYRCSECRDTCKGPTQLKKQSYE